VRKKVFANRSQELVSYDAGIDAEAAFADRLFDLVHARGIDDGHVAERFFNPLQQARSSAQFDFVATGGRDRTLRGRLFAARYFLCARRPSRFDRTTTTNLHNHLDW
jgi:hypothetical protein